MIELLKGFPDNVAAFAYHGHVTTADYDQVLIPDFEDRLRRHKKLRIYFEIAPDLEGFDPGAVWEDQKFGFSHFFDWERCAVVTDVSLGETPREVQRVVRLPVARESTGRFQKLKPTKHENGLLQQNSERLAHLTTRTHQRGVRCKNFRAIGQLLVAPPPKCLDKTMAPDY